MLEQPKAHVSGSADLSSFSGRELVAEFRKRLSTLQLPPSASDPSVVTIVANMLAAFAKDDERSNDQVQLRSLDESLAKICTSVFGTGTARSVSFAAICAISLLITPNALAETPQSIEELIQRSEKDALKRKKTFEVVRENAVGALLNQHNDQFRRRASKDEIFPKLIEVDPHAIHHTEAVMANMNLPLRDPENLESLMCLAANVYHEARQSSEGKNGGQKAVLLTTLVRSKAGDICGAVRAKGQFSWTFDKKILQNITDEKSFNEIVNMIMEVAGNATPSELKDVLIQNLQLDFEPEFYHRHDMSPNHEKAFLRMSPRVHAFFTSLVNKGYKTKVIGAHLYYGKAISPTRGRVLH